MTTRKTTLSKVGAAAGVPAHDHSTMPRPMPAAKAIGSDSMRATTAAARRGQEHGGALAGDAGRDAGERRLEDEGERGQAAGDRPHDRRQPADRDAEQQGPVGVLGRGPHGDAGVGAQQEPGEPGDDERARRAMIRIWSPIRRLVADVELKLDRDRRSRSDQRRDAERLADARAARCRRAAGPGRCVATVSDEPGRVLEAADDQPTSMTAAEQRRRRRRASGQHEEVRPAVLEVQRDRRATPKRLPIGAVGEVDEPVGAVDEDEPDRQQRVDRAEDDRRRRSARAAPCPAMHVAGARQRPCRASRYTSDRRRRRRAAPCVRRPRPLPSGRLAAIGRVTAAWGTDRCGQLVAQVARRRG